MELILNILTLHLVLLSLFIICVRPQDVGRDCRGKDFDCVDDTSFQICIDTGDGMTRTVDHDPVKCAEGSYCNQNDELECGSTEPPSTKPVVTTDTTTAAPATVTEESKEKEPEQESNIDESNSGDATGEDTEASPTDLEAEVPEAEIPDAEAAETELSEAKVPDAEVTETEVPEAEIPEAEIPEAEITDAEITDAEIPDAEVPEAENPGVEVPEVEEPSVKPTEQPETNEESESSVSSESSISSESSVSSSETHESSIESSESSSSSQEIVTLAPVLSTPAPFSCSQPGKFAHPTDCEKYYVCIWLPFGIFEIEQTCLFGFAFDPALKRCSSDRSRCINDEFVCAAVGRYPHPSDNTKYYWCIQNSSGGFVQYSITCPDNLEFNELSNNCGDLPTEDNLGVAYPGNEKQKFECVEEGTFADPNDCGKYIICTLKKKDKFKKKEKKCPKLQKFDSTLGVCAPEENVVCLV